MPIEFKTSVPAKTQVENARLRLAAAEHEEECGNAYAAGRPIPLYAGPSLVGADLSNMMLPRINLIGQDLTGTKFTGTILAGANFTNTVCFMADFSEATECTNVCFYGADLRKANFADADCRESDFSQALCTWASFFRADLSGADFSDAGIYDADFDQAVIDGTALLDDADECYSGTPIGTPNYVEESDERA